MKYRYTACFEHADGDRFYTLTIEAQTMREVRAQAHDVEIRHGDKLCSMSRVIAWTGGRPMFRREFPA